MPQGESFAGKRMPTLGVAPTSVGASTLGQAHAVPGAAARKVVVFLHGAGNFQPNYEIPWVDELTKRLQAPFAHLGVYYANIINSSPTIKAMAAAPDSGEQARFEAEFGEQLRRAYDSIPHMHRTPRVTSFALNDIAAAFTAVTRSVGVYLFKPNIATEIQKCVVQSMDQAMANYDDIVFVSHSLGTVIAFDVLRESGDRYNKISAWFTTGCPLGKLRQIGMRGDDLGAITRANIAHWYNVYDSTDLIADPLGPFFPRPGFRLHDIFVDVARDPVASHDYLRNSETLDLIAEAMR